MRKVDAESFNKRLVSEILELKNTIENISPEHINQFDADLIGTANQYLSLLTDSTWADNSNFNSIELGKLKQLINYIKSSRKEIFAERSVTSIDTKFYAPTTEYQQFRIVNDKARGSSTFSVPEGYDGRMSFVKPTIKVLISMTDEEENVYYKIGFLSDSGFLKHTQKETNRPHYLREGDLSARLDIVKTSGKITINHNANFGLKRWVLKDTVRDVVWENNYKIEKIFLDVLFVYWRNK
jgi:hypothetical protein